MSKKNVGSFQISKFPKTRIPTLDFLALGEKNHYVMSLIEVDVTDGRQNIIKYENDTGIKLSFTAWLLKCIGQAASEHKAVHSLMMGKQNIIQFNDVDISITVEKNIKGAKAPMPLVIRKTNVKTLLEIHEEIRAAQKEDITGASILGNKSSKRKMKLYISMPKFFRQFLIKRILKDPLKVKEMMGTIILTSLGMFGKVRGWPIPTTAHPLAFAIGGITKKPAIINDQIKIREFLTMTILFNHDVVDGAPAARFLSRLVDLIESGLELKNH
jgi:pyruvate/2-oxoglutarate dehydrogenase complex dihydrolipoamide acyltransferase (E2) component